MEISDTELQGNINFTDSKLEECQQCSRPSIVKIEKPVRRVWLIKVPRDIDWKNPNPGEVLGSLRLYRKKELQKTPKMTIHVGGKQYLLKEIKSEMHISIFSEKDDQDILIEGNVVFQASCTHDLEDYEYQKVLFERKEKSEQREVPKGLENARQTVSSYSKIHDIKLESQRESRSPSHKYVRKPEDQLRSELFSLFEKQRYYLTKDLMRLTSQPLQFLKSVLQTICQQHGQGLLKDCWELLPEFQTSSYDEQLKNFEDYGQKNS
ncbi:general transcription factor IIF subunit 2-like isoform X1 [Zophobas morio]|uniref:general transcription factor IIF subunit 2-like isoform X1 n=1 Tax=Zophobas morio TaxID=2755281 RepID=UPI003082F1C9